MDGARLFNAAVYLKVLPSRIVRDFTSATFCIFKGLGAPVGAVLIGARSSYARKCHCVLPVDLILLHLSFS